MSTNAASRWKRLRVEFSLSVSMARIDPIVFEILDEVCGEEAFAYASFAVEDDVDLFLHGGQTFWDLRCADRGDLWAVVSVGGMASRRSARSGTIFGRPAASASDTGSDKSGRGFRRSLLRFCGRAGFSSMTSRQKRATVSSDTEMFACCNKSRMTRHEAFLLRSVSISALYGHSAAYRVGRRGVKSRTAAAKRALLSACGPSFIG